MPAVDNLRQIKTLLSLLVTKISVGYLLYLHHGWLGVGGYWLAIQGTALAANALYRLTSDPDEEG